MAFQNASGACCSTKSLSIQLEVPGEPATDASMFAINPIAIFMAVLALVTALKSGDSTAIAAAIQALIKAITG